MAKAFEVKSPFYAAGEFPFNKGILKNYLRDEEEAVAELLSLYQPDQQQQDQVLAYGNDLIQGIRSHKGGVRVETFLGEYGLDNKEGVILMSLAEALLRIPDTPTAERFVKDKLGNANWGDHIGQSDTFWVNFYTRALSFTGKFFKDSAEARGAAWFSDQVKNLVRRLGEPLALSAIKQAMLILSRQFIGGETICEAIANSGADIEKGYQHAYGMLGEAAICQQNVSHYMDAYQSAISGIAEQYNAVSGKIIAGKKTADTAALSIKLSALHPRFELKQPQGLKQLKENLLTLLTSAHKQDIPITLDAEESWRLEPQLKIFADIIGSEPFRHWGKLGLTVQAYQKRALPVLDWLITLGKSIHCQIPVRLVKGAYWDSEIKRAQQLGLNDYPVYTFKAAADLSYLVCAQKLITEKHFLLPQFATHNAHTIASILSMSQQHDFSNYELQRLHGMGDALYDHLLKNHEDIRCRIYAPVGHHKEVMPYLVRRLLENGANTSFVRLLNQNAENERLLASPISKLKSFERLRNISIPKPGKLFSPARRNSQGLNLESSDTLNTLKNQLKPCLENTLHINDNALANESLCRVFSPADRTDLVGTFVPASQHDCHQAFDAALKHFSHWKNRDTDERAELLLKAANLLEENAADLIALNIREAGKNITSAHDELREAIDYCRYYASQARNLLSEPIDLTGPTGEKNFVMMEGKGVMLCISPWNYPLAIFAGQIAAALVAGNTVLAKPSTSTPLIAARVIELFHKAGFPKESLHYLPAPASVIESSLLTEPRLGGVIFTGSTQSANQINRLLAATNGPIIPLIAETGGQNAMIVDSSALPEQVVRDIAASAFDNAGQRCSSLRVVFIQQEIKDTIIELLCGHLAELQIGDPSKADTDIGPVISSRAQGEINLHIDRFRHINKVLYQCALPSESQQGYYVPPTLIEIDHLDNLYDEVFGPVLHIASYCADQVDDVLQQINSTGFGLTLGIHTRIKSFSEYIAQRANVGNVYVNRNMITATPGVQPFGGRGFSGTGPKAGGPHYLLRLVNEKTCSINTTATGANARLLTD